MGSDHLEKTVTPGVVTYDIATERRILRKIDYRLVPCLMVMYFANCEVFT